MALFARHPFSGDFYNISHPNHQLQALIVSNFLLQLLKTESNVCHFERRKLIYHRTQNKVKQQKKNQLKG
jgi:hypothetical protein